LWAWQVGEPRAGLCPIAGFGISDAEPSGSVVSGLFELGWATAQVVSHWLLTAEGPGSCTKGSPCGTCGRVALG
jgi:hypothetical protein